MNRILPKLLFVFCPLIAVLASVCVSAVVAQTDAIDQHSSYAIVSVSRDKKMVVYKIDQSDGTLAIASETDVTGNPGCSVASKDGKRLYVAMKKSNSIATFAIGEQARLEFLGESHVGAAASFVTLDPTGNFLLSSYYAAGKVAVHKIDEDGTLGETPVQMFATDERAHCVTIDPSGKYAYVSHTRPNAIFQFGFDPATGTLTPSETSKLIRDDKGGPRHLWFHPTNGHAYGSDEQGSSLTNYRLNNETGELTVVETLSALPPGTHDGKKSTSDIEVHPSGKFVFIANRGVNSIASFSINEQSGGLTLLEHSPTVPMNRSFNISPDGKFLIAAGQKSDKIRVFRIGDDGKMKVLSTHDTGKSPWWVQIVER